MSQIDWQFWMQEWCRKTGKAEADFFIASCQDNFTIKRRVAHWKQYKILHPDDQSFLRKELECGSETTEESEGKS